jgi:glycosyltransferase involved in cell wall biosynthesis
MRVGLNALHLVPGETGGSEIYARRLIKALLAVEPSLEPTLFVTRELAGERWAERVRVVSLPVSGRSRLQRVLAEQTLLPAAVSRSRVELLHNLFTTAPAVPGVPQVTTIHDLIYKRFPAAHKGLLAYGMRLLVPLAARRSRRLIAVSEATKADIIRFLAVPGERVDVTYEGPGMEADAEPTPRQELRARLELGNAPVVLTVSAKRPHKNLERLFEAFAELDSDAVLVVPGYETAFEARLQARAAALAPGRIRFTGWLDDRDLEGLYRNAVCLVFPSLAEGFGLPVLEALARGLPVTCSNASSLPEIAGDAAVYFDPYDTNAIARSLERLLSDQSLRARLADAGRERAALFSWHAAAERTIESYRLALRQS